MKKIPDSFSRLIESLQILPNVGPKTATRIACDLLLHGRAGAARLAEDIQAALHRVRHCRLCNTFCENAICPLCADEQRDGSRLMIVAMPADIAGMEEARCHDGRYFVLMGQINPVQDKDLQHIALDALARRVADAQIEEVIIATGYTAEGEITAFAVYELLKNLPLKISRLSRGIPLGGEIEYVDAGTLAQAVYERQMLKD